MKADIYTSVTTKILADLERGVRPWLKPWNAKHAAGRITRPLRANGEAYRGINILMLWGAAGDAGYAAPIWMIFKQAKELGGHVRKGEKSAPVVYASRITCTETNEKTGEEEEREIPFMKSYSVFNVEQIDGLPADYYELAETTLDPVARIEAAEHLMGMTGAQIRHGGNRAFYAMGSDHVQLPPFETFRDAQSYYATAAHELTHWTRHPTRLHRDFGRKRWGDEGYAMEELVAEIGAAFLSAELGITPEPREDHAAYLRSWLTVLQQDTRAIFTAASHAQKAVDFLLACQGEGQAA